jgi:hypothetical protein
VITRQVRQESNPQPTVLETVALPIELLTYARGGRPLLSLFTMLGVLTATPAVFSDHKTISIILAVLFGGVVALFALTARER